MTKAGKWFLIGSIIFLMVGWRYRMPKHLSPGVYHFEERTSWERLPETAFKLQLDNISALAPTDYKVMVNTKNAGKIVYASFPLGNTEQKVHYLALLDKKSKWKSLYVDSNDDKVFDEQDRVALSFAETMRGAHLKYTIEPLSIPVAYKTSMGRTIRKHLLVEIYLFYHPNNDMAETMHRVVSWFEGEGRFSPKKGLEYPVRVGLVDVNGDGIFNNFSQDAVYIDLNYDGLFDKREKAPFSSLFELEGPGRHKKQYRNYVFQWPYRLAVVPVEEWESASFYEPPGDPSTGINQMKPAENPKNTPKNPESLPREVEQ